MEINQPTLEGFFHYLPNNTMCYVAVALFLLSGMFITVVSSRYKNWLLSLVVLTSILEILGFTLRYACIQNPTKSKFAATSVLHVAGPNILALVNYVAIAKLAQRYRSTEIEIPLWLNQRGVSITLVLSDIVAVVFQCVGVIILCVSNGIGDVKYTRSLKLLEAGFALQLIFFTFFLFFVIFVNKSNAFLYERDKMRPLFALLYTTIVCLYLRTIYRLIQFIDDTSYITVHEEFYYVFDSLMVLICILLYGFFPIVKYLPRIQSKKMLDPKSPSLKEVKSIGSAETEDDGNTE